jgi:starch synthase (maltosyl-transferring)
MNLQDFISDDRQIIIERITPEIDCGRYPVKRVIGDTVEVQADIFRDGHDLIAAAIRYRYLPQDGESQSSTLYDCQEVPLVKFDNDRWKGEFKVTEMGRYAYQVEAWTDRFSTWEHDMEKRVAANQVEKSDVLEGVALVKSTLNRLPANDRQFAERLLQAVENTTDPVEAGRLFLTDEITGLMSRYPDRSGSAFSHELEIIVDPVNARFAAWYELFPRSQGKPGQHGTFLDVIEQLPRIKGMGFDVLYLPPIHPIGRSNRKGPNNTLTPGPNDPGSPWAIGNENGGHKAIEPALGTFEDFDRLVEACRAQGISLALDFAIQCSPDHPWVKSHPEWFFVRPDGTIKYAENPPKKYQDIYPINFFGEDPETRKALWEELKSVLEFWVARGIKIFRVDNPHTKALPFWEWVIGEIKKKNPETLFLAEAFTRPKVMRALAKAGFSQSYTYFTWRNTRAELTEYLTELTQSEMKEYYRGNLWPNTPDILHEFLQHGGLPAFRLRLVLAATLSSVYGMYSGYELGINTPVRPGSEEYLNSDKYQVNHYDWNQPHYLGDFITRVNRIRRENPALQLYDNLRFYKSGNNDNILVYGKATPRKDNIILVVVNLDPFHAQDSWIGLPFWEWGIGENEPYQVEDLLTGQTYTWQGEYNYVRLDPAYQAAHIFQVTPPRQAQEHLMKDREIDFS